MNALIVAAFATLVASAIAAPSVHGGAILTGPAGVVTSHGAIGPIGPIGHGWGLGHGATVLAAPHASTVVAGPALGWGLGHGIGLGAVGVSHGAYLAAPVVAAHGLGVGAITNGGGTIGVSAHGATVQGPPTVPAVIAGPAGKIVADGLWGPTSNIGHGHGW